MRLPIRNFMSRLGPRVGLLKARLKRKRRYRIDFEDLERQLNSDTKAFLLCNPHNPTGNCWSREDLDALVSLCAQNGTVVLSDETLATLLRKGRLSPRYFL